MIRGVDALLLSLRCVLAAVFLVAAAGKLLDLGGSRRALTEFGVPPTLARIGGVGLPLAELSVGAALLARPSARWAAAGALVLLLLFVAGVARAMSQGRTPDCHCFGQIHSEPAGPATLARNLILALVAAFVMVKGSGPSLDGSLGSLHGAQIALVATSAVAALLAVAVAQLWGDRRRLVRERDEAIAARAPAGLPRGTAAPELALMPLQGESGLLADLVADERPAVLVFVSTSCAPCLQLLPLVARWQTSLSGSVTLAPIFAGDRSDAERLSAEHGLSVALWQRKEDAFDLYALRATPSAVLVDRGGMIASAPAEGVPAIEALIRSAVARSAAPLQVEHA